MIDTPLISLILAAAGSGIRFGSAIPKQFTPLQGKPVYLHALDQLAEFFSQVVVVVPHDWENRIESQIRDLTYRDKLVLQSGGPQRQDSVYRGLQRLSQDVKMVLIHDAARPFVSSQLIARVIEKTVRHHACAPVLPVGETIKEVKSGRVIRTLDRECLRFVQTPQGFEINLLKRAFEQALKEGFYANDEATIVERLGETVYVVTGESGNIKVTWKGDL